MVLIREALDAGEELLRVGGHGNEANESRWGLCSVLGIGPGELTLRQCEALSPESYESFLSLMRRRSSGEPFQYVLGDVEFGDLVLQVGPGVLIPRPETEELVELCCELVVQPHRICDLCTGSGAICLSLARHFPEAMVYGSDLSEEALSWARKNCSALGFENVRLFWGDLFSAIPAGERFELIVSNPPYVSEEEYAELDSVVKDWEPRLALVAEDDGLRLLRRIAEEGMERLQPGGWLACEMGDRHGPAMSSCLSSLGYESVAVRKDLFGQDRMVFGRRPR